MSWLEIMRQRKPIINQTQQNSQVFTPSSVLVPFVAVPGLACPKLRRPVLPRDEMYAFSDPLTLPNEHVRDDICTWAPIQLPAWLGIILGQNCAYAIW